MLLIMNPQMGMGTVPLTFESIRLQSSSCYLCFYCMVIIVNSSAFKSVLCFRDRQWFLYNQMVITMKKKQLNSLWAVLYASLQPPLRWNYLYSGRVDKGKPAARGKKRTDCRKALKWKYVCSGGSATGGFTNVVKTGSLSQRKWFVFSHSENNSLQRCLPLLPVPHCVAPVARLACSWTVMSERVKVNTRRVRGCVCVCINQKAAQIYSDMLWSLRSAGGGGEGGGW